MSRKSKRRRLIERIEKKAEAAKTLTWRVHPFMERRLRSALAVGATALFTVCVSYFAPPNEPFYLGVPPFMFVVLNGFWLPTTYALTDDGIEIRRLFHSQKADWGRFRSFNYDNEAAVLSPYEGPTRRAMFRTLTLLFGKGRKAEILDYLRGKLIDVKDHATATDGKADGPETDSGAAGDH